MKKALLIVCLFISVIASGQGNFFWSHNSEYRLGYLYNWYVATDSRNISNTGWHVPTHDECLALQDYSVSALKLKNTSIIYWTSTDGTNEYLFNAKGSGTRIGNTGSFTNFRTDFYLWNSDTRPFDSQFLWGFTNSGSFYSNNTQLKQQGYSIRLVKDSTTLTHGQTGTYIGNNGLVYKTVCIGAQEWLADNLRETKWRNGTDIPNVTDNTAWSALTTPAWCVYDNNFKYR